LLSVPKMVRGAEKESLTGGVRTRNCSMRRKRGTDRQCQYPKWFEEQKKSHRQAASVPKIGRGAEKEALTSNVRTRNWSWERKKGTDRRCQYPKLKNEFKWRKRNKAKIVEN
jgi:hypothetical protein